MCIFFFTTDCPFVLFHLFNHWYELQTPPTSVFVYFLRFVSGTSNREENSTTTKVIFGFLREIKSTNDWPKWTSSQRDGKVFSMLASVGEIGLSIRYREAL